MKVTVEYPEAFLAALSDEARAGMPMTTKAEYLFGVAVKEHGWTLEQLAAECSRALDDATSVAGLITARLEVASTVSPPKPKKPAISKGVPFCTPECKENAGWVLDNNGRPHHKCECRSVA